MTDEGTPNDPLGHEGEVGPTGIPAEDPGLRDQDAVDEMEAATKDIPTYVCVTGAPGAGKSAIAALIAEYYDLDLVDNYAQDLAKDMDIALGLWASYVPNLMVAMEREKADHKARRSGERGVVVVGSLIESMAYAGIKAELAGQQITTPQQQGVVQREMFGMQFCGLMLQDLMRFQHFFFVKLPTEVIVPGVEPKFDNATRSLDNAISTIIGQISVPMHELTGSLDQQLESVKDTIGHLAKS